MAKNLSANQKEEILEQFLDGKTINELSSAFNCAKQTISRNLKKIFGEEKFKLIIQKNKLNSKNIPNSIKPKQQLSKAVHTKESVDNNNLNDTFQEKEFIDQSSFTEITPLFFEIDNEPQKDLTSVPLNTVNFPDIVYMVVDKNIELQTKFLKDYPEWQYLSENDLNRKTIEIFFEMKIAKNKCNKDQKVIKVPNTKVFEIVKPILVSRGISRIVNNSTLISL